NGWDCRNHGDCQNSRGVYALVKYTLAGHPGWHGNLSDHTHSDDVSRGYMMQVDAGSTSGQFYETTIDDLCSGSELYFSVWILNVNTSSSISGLNFHIENADNGTVITDYTTSTISAHSNISDAQWERYGMSFTIPAGVTRVRLSLNNPNASTSGNDFAIDDIEIRLCVPQINIPASETELCSGQTYNVNATYLNEGTFVEPLQYQWFYSETGDPLDNSVWEAVAGQTAEDLSMANVQEANEGYYRLAISAQGNILTNCRALSEPIHLTVNPTPDAAISIVGDTEVCSGEDAVLAASPTGLSYVWSTTETSETINIHPTQPTTYNVTVTQGTCSNEASIEVGNCSCELTAETTQTDGFCAGDIVIEAEGLNGSGDYSYAWDGGQASAQIVGADVNHTYTVVVTDNSTHCTADASITTSRTGYPTIAEPTVSTILCNGGTATITLSVSNGFGEYSYEWHNSENATVGTNSNELADILAGTYTVTVTDEHSCTTSTSVTVNQPNPVVVSADKTDKVCATLGTAFVTSVTGGSENGYQYQWTNDANGQTIGNGVSVTDLAGGNYTVLVTDSNECPGTAQVTIEDIGGTVSFTLTAHKLRCNGDASGSIDVENITGRSPYSIVWTSTVANGTENDVMTSPYEISDLPAGNYTIIVTDADECSSTLTTTVEEPALLVASASLVSSVMCFGDKFDITVSAEGGSLADGNEYSYHWINDVDVQSQTALEDFGLYSVTVTDDNGCIATSSVNVEEPSQVQITISASDILCNGQTSTVTVTGNGGTGVYSGTGTFENVNAGSHTYTIADENGCSASDDITITEPDELGVNFNNIVAQTCETLGSVELSISNAQGNTTYSWDGGNASAYTSATTEHLGSGSHTVSVTDGNGCTATATVDIPNNSGMTLSPNPSQPARCFGENSGSIMIDFVNGTSPYIIMWNGNLINETNDYHYFDNLTAGTYDVSVTDANGCSGNTSVEIGQPDDFVATASITSTINCHNDAFDISVSVQGGNGGYTYMWDGSVAGQSQSGLTEYRTYNVIVTDAEGCTATSSVTPENPQGIAITSIVADAIQCHGGTTVVNAYAGGGSGTLNYTWATEGVPAVNSQQITAPAGTYSLTVTDGNGCWISTTYVVDNPNEISIEIASTTEQYCTTLGEVQLTVGGGTGNLSYTWDGNTINPVVGGSIVSQLSAGTHTLTVTDGNGCTATLPVAIDYGAEMSVTASQPDSVRCFGETNGEFTISMDDGLAPYTIVWNNGTITEYSNVHTFANLPAGTYGITVTDAHNCMEMISVEVGGPERLMALSSAERILCHGETAEVTVSATGGTLPYQNTGVYNLGVGEYDYRVVDARGCESTTHVSLTEPMPISVNAVAVNAPCYGGNGRANLIISGGTNPYSVVWQDNSTGLDNTHIPVNTNFGYTVTDLNGCTYDGTVTVGQPQQLSLDLSVTPVSCFGLEDARVGVSQIGGGTMPYNYLWSNGNTVNTLVGVGAGTYSLLVTDANGCTISSTAVVMQPEALNVSVISSNVECGISNGSLSANVYGGSQPYVYYWSNGGTSALLDNVSAGAYTLTVTDANRCSATVSSQISVVGMLTASIVEESPVSCFGMTDATLVAVVDQAQPPVRYQWNNDQNGSTLFGLGTGMYMVTVTDGWGCQGVANYMLYSPTALIMSSQVTDANCSNTSEGAISLTVGGGRPPYSYLWTTGSTEPNLEDLRVGTYGVLVTDMSGCTLQENFVISAPTTISVEADVTDVTCYGKKDGRVEINVTGGVEPYAYGFYMGNTVSHSGRIYEHLRPGVYNISVSDANGCGKSISVAVGQPERLGVNSLISAPSCKDLHDATVEIVTAGGTAPFTYTLGTYTSDSSIFINLHPGLYSAVVTDANGCSNEISEIVVPESKLDCLRIPNVITPNGDGVNDEWIIENIELFPEAHIYVYNRWGQLLYHGRGDSERWDGSYRGHFVPAGVYMYIIKLDSVEETYEGTVTVLY
ncbi:MAG: gliding motility-associated C-terminal domain-containing protein, partial [Bacteroidales bacterium]|nr:gliding motility-associated C-terminal domain-containing protein [Bacteroidales bacterium]